MANLTNEVKAFIVQGLAQYKTPTEIANEVYQEFSLEIERSHVVRYDPTKSAGINLSQKWRDYFSECREKFKSDISAIPIANLAVRLNRLEQEYQRTKNPKLKIEVLEQAAKEVGEVFTNKSKVDNTSSDGSMATKPTIIELVAQPFPHETTDTPTA